MSLDLKADLLDEIALEGLDGITINALWTRLQDRQGFSLPVDDKSKIYLWKCVLSLEDIEFFQLSKPRPDLVLYDRFHYVDPESKHFLETENIPEDIYPIHMLSDQPVLGSCAEYTTRINVTKQIIEDKLPLEATMKKYGNKLVCVASQAARLRALIGPEKDPSYNIHYVAYCLLERIGRARFCGEAASGKHSLTQIVESSKTLFYQMKKLRAMSVLKKQRMCCIRKPSNIKVTVCLYQLNRFFRPVVNKTQTDIMILARYLDTKPERMNVVLKTKQTLKIFDKNFKKCAQATDANGDRLFEFIDIPWRELHPNATPKEYLLKNGRAERTIRHIRLLKTVKEVEDRVDPVYSSDEEEEEKVAEDAPKIPYCREMDLPYMYQVLDTIRKAGSRGLSQVELQQTMRTSKLTARRHLKFLYRMNYVTTILQNKGKQKEIMYVSVEKFKDNVIHKSVSLEQQKLGEEFASYTIDRSINRHKKETKKKEPDEMEEKEIKEETSEQETPKEKTPKKTGALSLELPTEEKISEIRAELIKLDEDCITAQKPPSQAKIEVMREMTEDGTLVKVKIEEQTMKSVHLKKSDKTVFGFKIFGKLITDVHIRRINWIVEVVTAVRVLENFKLLRLLRNREKELKLPYKMDQKSLKRLIVACVQEQKIRTYWAKITLGDRMREYVCEYSVTPHDTDLMRAIDQAKLRYFSVSKEELRKKAKLLAQPPESPPKPVVPKKLTDIPETAVHSIQKHQEWRQKLRMSMPNMKYNRKAGIKYGLLPKMLRIQACHQLLWHICYDTFGYEIIESSNMERQQETKTTCKGTTNFEVMEDDPTFAGEANEEVVIVLQGEKKKEGKAANPGKRKSAPSQDRSKASAAKKKKLDKVLIDDRIAEVYLDVDAQEEAMSVDAQIDCLETNKDGVGSEKDVGMDKAGVESEKDVGMDKVGAESEKDVGMDKAGAESEKDVGMDKAGVGSEKDVGMDKAGVGSEKDDAGSEKDDAGTWKDAGIKKYIFGTEKESVGSKKDVVGTEKDNVESKIDAGKESEVIVAEKDSVSKSEKDIIVVSEAIVVKSEMDIDQEVEMQSSEQVNQAEKGKKKQVMENLVKAEVPYPALDQDKVIMDEPLSTSTLEWPKSEPHIYMEEMSWRRYLPPVPAHSGYPKGWVLISDILLNLPVYLFCQLVNVCYDITGLVEILNHPLKRFYPVIKLPFVISQQLLHSKKYIQSFFDLCSYLCEMGLLSFGKEMLKEKDQTFIYLHQNASMLDTRESRRGYNKTRFPEGKDNFPLKSYKFSSMSDINTFWEDLQIISMASNLNYKSMVHEDVEDSKEYTMRPIHQAAKAYTPDTVLDDGVVPGDMRGAAGFDSGLFVHTVKNWTFSSLSRTTMSEKPYNKLKLPGPGEIISKRKIVTHPHSIKGKDRLYISDSAEKPVQIKKVTRDNVKGNKGGRGLKKTHRIIRRGEGKLKHKRTIKIPAPPVPRKKPFEKGDDKDRAIYAKRTQQRVIWTNKEDSVEASHDKTSIACARRLKFVLKNPQTEANLLLYYREANQDPYIRAEYVEKVFINTDKDIKAKFFSLTNLLLEKFQSLNLQRSALPATVGDLSGCRIDSINKIHSSKIYKDVKSREDICHDVLRNILHSAVLLQDKMGRTHEMFKLLTQYPDALLGSVIKELRSDGLFVIQKKQYARVAEGQIHSGLGLRNFKVSQRYMYNYKHRNLSTLFEESADFLDLLCDKYLNNEGEGQCELLDFQPKGPQSAIIIPLVLQGRLDINMTVPQELVVVDMKGFYNFPWGRGKNVNQAATRADRTLQEMMKNRTTNPTKDKSNTQGTPKKGSRKKTDTLNEKGDDLDAESTINKEVKSADGSSKDLTDNVDEKDDNLDAGSVSNKDVKAGDDSTKDKNEGDDLDSEEDGKTGKAADKGTDTENKEDVIGEKSQENEKKDNDTDKTGAEDLGITPETTESKAEGKSSTKGKKGFALVGKTIEEIKKNLSSEGASENVDANEKMSFVCTRNGTSTCNVPNTETDPGVLPEGVSGFASRTLLSLRRAEDVSFEDIRVFNAQDNFVVNSCKIKIKLRDSVKNQEVKKSEVVHKECDNIDELEAFPEQTEDETQTPERKAEFIDSLKLSKIKMTEMWNDLQRLLPFQLDIDTVWSSLVSEGLATTDLDLHKQVYSYIEEHGCLGVRVCEIQEQFNLEPQLKAILLKLQKYAAQSDGKEEPRLSDTVTI